MKVSFSPAASDDLMEIAIYIAQDSPKRALSFVDELEATCNRLGNAPGIGTARPELGQDLRMWPHGNYLIFYRHQRQVVRIERIMHGSCDIGGEDIASMDMDADE